MRVQSTVWRLLPFAFFALDPSPSPSSSSRSGAGTLIDARAACSAMPPSPSTDRGRQARQRRGGDRDPRSLAFTVLPGLIDHPCPHRRHSARTAAVQCRRDAGRCGAGGRANAHAMLMAGFTSAEHRQRIDVPLRDAIARGQIVGRGSSPRVHPAHRYQAHARRGAAVRAQIGSRRRRRHQDFRFEKHPRGRRQTLSDAQIHRACAKRKTLGKRIWVHAHAASAVRRCRACGLHRSGARLADHRRRS